MTLRKQATATAPTPAHPIQGGTGNGPLANPISLSTNPAGIGARLTEGGTSTNPALGGQEAQQGVDPAELDKAKLDTQQAQLQAQQAKAQVDMAKAEAAHASRMHTTSGQVAAGYVDRSSKQLASRMQGLLNRATQMQLSMPKLAAAPAVQHPAVGTPAAAPADYQYKPRTQTRSGQPLPANFKQPGPLQWEHDGAGGVRPAGQIAIKTPGALSHTWTNYAKPLLNGQQAMTAENVPLAPDWLAPSKDVSLARWSPAWAANRAMAGVSNLIGGTVRSTGGAGLRLLYGLGKGGYHLATHPLDSLSDAWNKPIGQSALGQAAGSTLGNAGHLILDRFTGPLGMLAGGAMNNMAAPSQGAPAVDPIMEKAIQARMEAQSPEAEAPMSRGSVMEWLTNMQQFLQPLMNTGWMQPQRPQYTLPSQAGYGGHSIRDLRSYL